MAGTKFDVIIGGISAKIAWENDGAFRKRYVRREIEQNLISQSEQTQLVSRADQRQTFQTSWAGGATWWKPLLTPDTINTFFESNHMDTWSEPGSIVPANKDTQVDISALLQAATVLAVGDSGDLFAIGETTIDDAGQRDVYKWVPASDTFVRETGYSSGLGSSHVPSAMVHDPTDGYTYILSFSDQIVRFNTNSAVESTAWITTGFTTFDGGNIVVHNGELMMYDGEKVYRIDKAVPSVVQVFNDGHGKDFLTDMATPTTTLSNNLKLAVATPEGFYYVKNIRKAGVPEPHVFRVDKDAAGSYIGNPIAVLPSGSVATSIEHHMGDIIIATTPDVSTMIANDAATDVEVVLYVVLSNGINALGSMRGNRLALDESPLMIVGATGPRLYLSGRKRLWVYDAVRGGLHIVLNWQTAPDDGPFISTHTVLDSAGDTVLLIVGSGQQVIQKTNQVLDPDTVVNFGEDLTHYTLESNFFDANLPMELKELTKVKLLYDKQDGDQEWTILVSADDAAFVVALEASIAGVFAEASLTGTVGHQFRFKVIYQTKNTNRFGLRGVLVTFTTGEMVAEWDMLLDGDELLNVDNKIQSESAFYTSLDALAKTEGVTTLIDNVTNQEQNVSDGSTPADVKVVAVEIVKNKPGESLIRVIVREQ